MSSSVEGLPVGHRIVELKREFDAQVERPQGDDPRIAAFFGGLRSVFETEGIDTIFEEAFKERTDLGAIHAGGLARAAIQKLALRKRRKLHFPADYEDGEQYAQLITTLLRDPDAREEFREDVLTRNVQTNIADRGKGPKLLMTYYQERFGDRPVNILDVGCGRNHMLKKMALTEIRPNIQYGHTTVNIVPGSDLEQGAYLTGRFNKALRAGGLAIGESVGIDKEALGRQGEKEWSESSFYPKELLDPATRRSYRQIDSATPPNVGFKQIDVFDTALHSPTNDAREAIGFTPDFILLSAMQYQLNATERSLVHDLVRRWVNPEGVILHLDFAQVSPDDPSSLAFFSHWDPYTFRLIVEDMKQPDELQEIMNWQNGRCEQAVLGKGKLIVDDEQKSLASLLDGDMPADFLSSFE